MTPRELRIQANGLSHRVLEWTASADDHAPVLLLIHGWMDTAGTWDLVAPTLANAGYRVLAPDMRGFGGTDRAPAGAYYHFPDYVGDLAGIVDALLPRSHKDEAPRKLTLVGHSMGGTIAALYTSARPDRVLRLALLEGTGPPAHDANTGAARLATWLDQLQAAAHPEWADARLNAMVHHVPAPREMMLRRLIRSHGGVDVETLRSRLPHLIEPAEPASPQTEQTEKTQQDAFVWRADPRHKMTGPTPFFLEMYKAHAARITCPTLIVTGGTTGYQPPDEAERRAAFSAATGLRAIDFAGAGHMLHWTRPTELAAELLHFAPPAADVKRRQAREA